MRAAPTRFPRLPTWLAQACLLLSLAYLLIAGVVASWSPALNGLDLSVCYVAGATASRGASPYRLAELDETRLASHPSVATKARLPFGYPPSAIPACAALSRLPWPVALTAWKLLNLGILIGCVLLTFRLFPDLRLTPPGTYLAWSLVFAFSPTVSVLLVGQSSLFVLCAALLCIVLAEQRRTGVAGICLALSLIKPHLVLALVGFLLVRRQYKVLLIAGVATAALTFAGLHLGHDSVQGFLQALQEYARWNSPTNPRLVGLPNLATGVLGLSDQLGSVIAVGVGLGLLTWVLAREPAGPRHDRAEQTLPAVLVLGVLAFRARSYDLVFLIPVCVWAMGKVQADRRFLPIVLLCALLVVPLGAVAKAYDLLLRRALGGSVFDVVIQPFRTWILLLLFPLVIHVISRPLAPAGEEARSRDRFSRV
jgi:hypothetical protein